MYTLNSTPRKPLVVLLAAALAASTLAAPLARAAVIEESVSVHPGPSLTPQEEEVISSAGAKVLQHVAEARASLARQDTKGAEEELKQAGKLLDIIQATVPATVVKDRIEVAKKGLEYDNTRTVTPDFIPLYSALDEEADFMALKTDSAGQAKQVKPAQHDAKSGRKEEPVDSALRYTEIDLPLHATRHWVDTARGYLAEGKTDEADQSLQAVEHAVLHVSVAMEQPLFAARTQMERASLDLDAGRRDRAQSELQAAIVQLEQAEKSADPYTRDGAHMLLKDARALQADLRSGKDVGMRMRGLWQHTKAYAERAEEYMSTGWAQLRGVSPFKEKLIEAKRYLSDAEIDLFVGREPAPALQDLQKSLGYLDEAASHAQTYYTDAVFKQKIAELQQSVRGIMSDPAAAGQPQFEAGKAELSHMIRAL